MINRRGYLCLLAAAGSQMLPGSTLAASNSHRFAPALGQYRFVRRLSRGLMDGNSIVVEREFFAELSKVETGFALKGNQKNVRVETPPPLHALAAIERRRQENNIFPVKLDGLGMIVAGPQFEVSETSLDAVRLAQLTLDSLPLAMNDVSQDDFLRMIEASAQQFLSRLPVDLFSPLGKPFEESREVRLPDGTVGKVSVNYSAAADPATGLLKEAKRFVTTELGSSQREASESWTLTPI